MRIVGIGRPPDQGNNKVFSFGISAYLNGDPQKTKTDHLLEPSIPSGALWPNASGIIVPLPRDRRSDTGDGVLRNPWEIRVGKKYRETPSAISCGGVITGAKDGDIAILNDRILKLGDVLSGLQAQSVREMYRQQSTRSLNVIAGVKYSHDGRG